MRFLVSVCALTLFASQGLASAQAVHVVDKRGAAGSQFTSINAAVAAASEGDMIVVRQGGYDEDVVIDGIGLRIQADQGSGAYVDKLRVRNLAAHQTVAIGGIGVMMVAIAITVFIKRRR